MPADGTPLAPSTPPGAAAPPPSPASDDRLPRWRSAFPRTWPVPTRWADNDHYGHVNNVAYYAYIDTAVNASLVEATGTDIRELDAIGIVVETACTFLAPLSFPDELEVGLAVARLGRSSVTYHAGVFRAGDEEPAALARFVHVYVDRHDRTSVAIPEVVRRALEPLVVPPTTAGPGGGAR